MELIGSGKENRMALDSPLRTNTRPRAPTLRTPQKDLPSPVRALIDPFVQLDVDTPTKSRKRSRADMMSASAVQPLALEVEDVILVKTPKKKRKIAAMEKTNSSTDLVTRVFQRTSSLAKSLKSVGRSSSKKAVHVTVSSSAMDLRASASPSTRASEMDVIPRFGASSMPHLEPSLGLYSNRMSEESSSTLMTMDTPTVLRTPQRMKRLRRNEAITEMKYSYSCATLPRNLRPNRPTVFTRTSGSTIFEPLIQNEPGWLVESGNPAVTTLDVSASVQSAMATQQEYSSTPGMDSVFSKMCPTENEPDTWFAHYFAGSQHQNYLAVEETHGLVSISVMRDNDVVRAIVRTDKAQDKIALPALSLLKAGGNNLFGKKDPKRSLLKAIIPPGWNLKNVKEVKDQKHVAELVMFESNEVATKFKWGVLHCVPGQTNEDAMFANNKMTPDFVEFLETIGEKITMKGWTGYTGGLDTTRNATGSHSFYTKYTEHDIMFHVAPLLPHDPECPQQLERKRHLGNDVVVIVFLENPADGKNPMAYLPTTIRTHFQHVLAVVQKEPGTGEKTRYRLHIARKDDVPAFGPELPAPSVYDRASFKSVLLSKLINGERAALKAPAFERAISRTRAGFINYYHQEYNKK